MELSKDHPKFGAKTHQCTFKVQGGAYCNHLMKLSITRGSSYRTSAAIDHFRKVHKTELSKTPPIDKKMQALLKAPAVDDF